MWVSQYSYLSSGEGLFDAWKSNNAIYFSAQYCKTGLLFKSHNRNTSCIKPWTPADTSDWCRILVWTQFSVVCLVSRHWLPGWEGEALQLRPAGSGLGLSFGRLLPFQTSARADLTKAPLQPSFMCPLMRKPPAQQPAIKHKQIKTPKYESATLPNSAGQARGVAVLYRRESSVWWCWLKKKYQIWPDQWSQLFHGKICVISLAPSPKPGSTSLL